MVAILEYFFSLVNELIDSIESNSVDSELLKETKKWLENSKRVIK